LGKSRDKGSLECGLANNWLLLASKFFSLIRLKPLFIRITVAALKGGVTMGHAYGGGFALIVVLFILLIIVGAAWL